ANRQSGGFLGETLLGLGHITPAQLGAVLEQVYDVPYLDLSAVSIDPAAVALIPEPLARQELILPIRSEEERLIVAMVHPLDLCAADELRRITGKRVTPVVTTERELQRAFYEHFDPLAKAHDALDALRADPSYTLVERAAPPEETAAVSDAPVVRLANS